MNLWYIAWRYLWQKPVITGLTVLGIVMGVALIVSVLTLERETGKAFREEAALFDLTVGAKGSPLQLTLSSIYHLDIPTGNIPYKRYEELKHDTRVSYAVPIGLGDNYKDFRIVGTEPHFFDLTRHLSQTDNKLPLFSIKEGHLFQAPFDAVLGYQVYLQTGMSLGSQFVGTHGLVSIPGSEVHHEFPYQVVGILNPTGTANDRAIFTPLESVWKVHEQEIHDAKNRTAGQMEDEKEVTAVLVQLRVPGMRIFLAEDIKNNTESMAAIPINEILRLYNQILKPMQTTLLAVAFLVVGVASLTVVIALYQSTERRRRDLALLRTLGAYRWEIFSLVLIEALWIITLGIGFGWLLGHGAIEIGSIFFFKHIGININAWSIDRLEGTALGLVFFIGIVAGFFPALLSYNRSPLKDISQS